MVAALGLTISLGILAQDPGDRVERKASDLLRAVAGAYDENRARFEFGSAEFEYWDGYARDFEAARRGDLKDAYAAAGTYSFDGKDALYTKIFPIEAMAATTVMTSANQGSSRLDSFRVLTNGKVTFTERVTAAGDTHRVARGHIITPGPDDFFRFAEFPLDPGRPESLRDDLAQNIRMVLDGAAGAGVDAIEEGAVVEGVETIRIALKFPNGKRTYWVDLERGAVPIQVSDDVIGGPPIDRHHGDIRYVEGRGWLPFAMTTFLKDGRVKRLVLKRAAFGRRPARDTFKLELAQPAAVANIAEGRAYTARAVWDLNHLPGPSSRDSMPLGTHTPPGRDLDLPGEREPRPPYFSIAAIVLSGAIGIAAWRRSRSR